MKPIPSDLWQFIRSFTKDYKRQWIILALMLGVSALYNTIVSYVMKDIVDNLSKPHESALEAALLPTIILVAIYQIAVTAWRVINYIGIGLVSDLRSKIALTMFDYVNNHSAKFFQDNFSGAIANNITRMLDNLESIYDLSRTIFRDALMLVFALVGTYWVNPLFAIALFIWVIIFILISMFYARRIGVLSHDFAESVSVLSGQINDSMSNANNVRLFAHRAFEHKHLSGYLDRVNNHYASKEWFFLRLGFAQGTSVTVLIGVMLWILIVLRSKDLVTVGDFSMILTLTLSVSEGIWWLAENITTINDNIGRCRQSLAMISTAHEIVDKEGSDDLSIEQGAIEFAKVSFCYPGSNNQLFNNLSVKIKAGERVGLVGYSGSGKTSFVHLIVRLFEVSSGKITIDGQDIAMVKQDSLRRNISFIPQDPVLFHRSLMDNIRYGRISASDSEVIASAKLAHADHFITKTPEGYNSMVGERGIKLSGGQRQRIAIARAAVKNAPILILDEATSALDSVTEGYIQDSLTALMQNKTVIVIAHRLSTLLHMDRILVFDKGEIVEVGSHTELLAMQGMYSYLWNSQIGGFLRSDDEEEVSSSSNSSVSGNSSSSR